MKRGGFKRKAPEWAAPRGKVIGDGYTPRPRYVVPGEPVPELPMAAPRPKSAPLQHAAYMAAVRRLRCYRCGADGFTQFCHSDEGKGSGIKSDCRLGWPGCGPHLEGGRIVNGCHHAVGTARVLPKEERRQFERRAAADTRREIRSLGLWPAGLPAWPGDEVQEVAAEPNEGMTYA